jgi:glycosyltransferase involved in cell wall biosynthesis
MKILYFSPHPHINLAAPSGPGTHMREVIAAFEEAGNTVVRCIAGGEVIEKKDAAIAFKKHRWKKFIPGFLWETLRDIQMMRIDEHIETRLKALIEKEKPDLIYERSCYGMGAGMRAAEKFGIRYVVEMNAPYPEEKAKMQGSSLLRFIGTRHEKKQVLHAYKTIVVSSAMKSYLIQKTGVHPDKIVIVANAVNPQHITPNKLLQEKIRQRFSIQPTHTVIGFVGSIFPYHGVDLMIEAFAALEKQNEALRMLIVGDGEIVPDLQKHVCDLNLQHKIHFTGNVPHSEVYDYLSLMDIAVMARSNWYGSPVKIFEYGAMQKAIIAPDVIPVRDVMIHEKDGLLVEATQEALTRSMRFMIEQPDARKRMAQAFHEKVMKEYTWKKATQHILAACQ